MSLPEYVDTREACKDCANGTYVRYVDGVRCRYCGLSKPAPRPKTTVRKKTDD